MPSALTGVRILDFTRYRQGPFATVLLEAGYSWAEIEQFSRDGVTE